MKISVPGKLFVIGEYAVLTPQHEAILIAVNRFITISLAESSMYEFSSAYGSFKWIMDSYDEPQFLYDKLPHAKAGIFIAHKYLKHLKIKPKKYAMLIESELNHADGQKYGLGSSGAILVATIKSILTYHNVSVTNQQLFKLCVLAQLEISDLTSGAELAASIYGGWVSYLRYDVAWLYSNKGHFMALVDQVWPMLEIHHLHIDGFIPCVCYSGIDKQTKDYVDKIDNAKQNSPYYVDFLAKAKKCVTLFKKALVNKDFDEVSKQMAIYRHLLASLGPWADIVIESETFTKIIDVAKSCHISAKTSGAGFGDCAIALAKTFADRLKVNEAWEMAGFESLDIKVWGNS